jgi:ABC-type transport system involved in multi-copper enzyme maturation permease subunit
MLNLLRSELFRLRKRPQSWMLLGIAFLLTAFVYGGFVVGARVSTGQERADLQEALTFPELPDFGLSFGLAFFGSVMLVIVAAGMMGNEYSWNTLRPLRARARSRASLLTAKLITVLIYSVLFCVMLGVMIGGLSIVSSAIAGIDAGFSIDAAREALEYTFKLVFANVPYMAFAFLLATVARSNAAGIAGALGLSFIEQPILQLLGLASDSLEKVEEFGLSYNLNAILGFGDGDGTRAAIILMIYTALFVAISYVVFLRRDVTSG